MCYRKKAQPNMATSQSKYGRRLDEESKRGVAALAGKPGASNDQVALDRGVKFLECEALERAGIFVPLPPTTWPRGWSHPGPAR